MNVNKHFPSYLAQFSLEWKSFQNKILEKLKHTHILFQ